MTREEAIYRLKNMAWLYGSVEREQNIEAINMAIEALQFAEHFDLLKEFQSLQEVVRCKDCRHADCRYADYRKQMPNQVYCHRDKTHGVVHDDDDFCKYGERRAK